MKKTNITQILKTKASVLTFKEILISSGEKHPELLRRRLHYYVKQGDLYALRRGIYAKDMPYNKFELATRIFTPAYISFETILAQAGIIFQHYENIFIASYQTKEIECDHQIYTFRKIKNAVLLNPAGIEDRETYYAATQERAFLDVLYLNKQYYFDNLSPLNWNKVQTLLPLYQNKRMENAVNRLFKNFETERISL